MKHSLVTLLLFSLTLLVEAQERIYIKVYQPNNGSMPKDVCAQMENKLTQLVTSNGIADIDPLNRFTLTSKVEIQSKEVVSGAPPKVALNLNFIFIIGDAVDNKILATTTLSVIGVGNNENKAYLAAIKNIKTGNSQLVGFLQEAKNKITEYYKSRCNSIKEEAKLSASVGDYEKSIYQLMQIPSVCDCAEECNSLIVNYSKLYNNAKASSLLQEAKALWASSPNSTGASKVADIISQMPIGTTSQKPVDELVKEIEQKVKSDERRKWNFKIRKYNDSVAEQQRQYKLQLSQQQADSAARMKSIEAARQIGIAYAQNQPKSIQYKYTKNVILW